MRVAILKQILLDKDTAQCEEIAILFSHIRTHELRCLYATTCTKRYRETIDNEAILNIEHLNKKVKILFLNGVFKLFNALLRKMKKINNICSSITKKTIYCNIDLTKKK